MIESLKDNDELQMTAYCDGELDPASALAFERRLAADQDLNARYLRLVALQRGVRSIPPFEVPQGLQDRLQDRIKAALDAERPVEVAASSVSPMIRPRPRSWSFRALAAAALFGAVISSSVMLTMENYAQRDEVASQVVAGHIRSLMAPQPFDVASSDRHTVKPWFTSRLPESPQVPDLAAQGFVLLGGRVDVIGKNPVATIVYKHAAHTVSLTTLRPGQAVPDQAISGYNVRSWSDGDFTYIAVSDLPAADLATFERVFASGPSAPEVK
jgi:anti-sigma factor RsiW